MSAFAAAIDILFDDPNIAVDALWRSAGVGDARSVRVVRKLPDRAADFGQVSFVTETLSLDVRVSEIPELAVSDTFEIASELFEVRSEPIRDSERLIWRFDARPI